MLQNKINNKNKYQYQYKKNNKKYVDVKRKFGCTTLQRLASNLSTYLKK